MMMTSTLTARPKAGSSLARRLVCVGLVHTLAGLSISPVFAEGHGGAAAGATRTALTIPEIGDLTAETSLQRMVRLLRTPGREPETIETLGIDLSLTQSVEAEAQGASVDDGRGDGLPWWAWLAIGAGAGWAATQIEFGDDDDEIDDD